MVTNVKMVSAAIDAGATGALVAHNYRAPEDLHQDINLLKSLKKRPFGVNITLDFENELFKKNLATCITAKVDFIITSLGDPKPVIDQCKPKGIKVFCDVTNLKHAEKAVARGADALIAVNNRAGGHAGKYTIEELLPGLVSQFNIPVISAGGVSNFRNYQKAMSLGAAGVSVGTAFIATHESNVSNNYKQAIIKGTEADVLLTRRISGVPMTVINTPYIKSIGTNRSWMERKLKRYRLLKHIIRTIIQKTHLTRFQHYVTGPDYQKVYCAGPSIENINKETSVQEVIERIAEEN